MKLTAFVAVVVCLFLLPAAADANFFSDIQDSINRATQDAAKAAQKAADDAAKTAQQAGERAKAELLAKTAQSTQKIVDYLKTLSLDTLYASKVSPDICASGTIDCEVLTNDKVRPLLDVELDRRKAALDYEDKSRSFLVSLGSLIVSLCAFGLSAFTFFRT